MFEISKVSKVSKISKVSKVLKLSKVSKNYYKISNKTQIKSLLSPY